MALLHTVATGAHVVFGALWTGAVVFVALLAGGLAGSTDALVDRIVDRLRLLSRTSAVVTLFSGGYLAAGYPHAYFTSSIEGLLISAMVLFWLVLMVSVEIGASRVLKPEANATPFLWGAGIVALLLVLDVSLLVAGV